MIVYALYWIDETDKAHFIGLLPERKKSRKNYPGINHKL